MLTAVAHVHYGSTALCRMVDEHATARAATASLFVAHIALLNHYIGFDFCGATQAHITYNGIWFILALGRVA